MKKKLMPMAVVLIIVAFAATVFAADPPKPPTRNAGPQRPGARVQRPGGRGLQKGRGMEMMIQQQAKRIESEITRISKVHEVAMKELQAILKQAKEEKATKTAALLDAMIAKKNAANAEKIKEIKKRAEDFKKRMQRRTKGGDRAGARPTRPSGRGNLPPRTNRTRTDAPAPEK